MWFCNFIGYTCYTTVSTRSLVFDSFHQINIFEDLDNAEHAGQLLFTT